jgi:hypothetical protein
MLGATLGTILGTILDTSLGTSLGTTLKTTAGATPKGGISIRQWLLASAFGLMAGGLMACNAADEATDTTHLPRLEGARELFSFPATTSYIAPSSVAQAADAAGKLLAADGWLQYTAPGSANANNPEFDFRKFRKGHQAVSVSVQRAPAQGNATAVTYTVVAFEGDQPVPEPTPATISTAKSQPAEPLVDVSRLPRLEGAKEDVGRSSSGQLSYTVAGSVPTTVAAARKLLAADGWKQFESPSEQPSATSLSLKKGLQGLTVFFTMADGRADQSGVNYIADRLTYALPFPDDATDIVFDERRPYLSCVTAGTLEATRDFLDRELGASGWSPLSATDAAARWPNADVDQKVGNGARAYYIGQDRRPILLSLQHRADDTIMVEIKIPPFAEPQDLEAGPESSGLPLPKISKTASSRGGDIRKELQAMVPAEVGPVLAFYRRELTQHNWKEESKGAVLTADGVALTFSSAEGTATLRLGRKYDLTTVNLAVQVSAAVVAAKAKAEKEATDKFSRDADALVRATIAGDAKRAAAAQAAKGPEAPLRPLAEKRAPVPVPETAENVDFNGTDGKLEFDSPSSVKALAAFYRVAMKPLGWKEQPSVINGPNLIELDFSKGGKGLTFTVMQLGTKANVRANGSGLVAAVAKPNVADNQPGTPAKATGQDLEADEDSGLPVPQQHSLSTAGTTTMPGGQSPFRRELQASVPAELGAVLAFYRSELAKREWKETAQGAVTKPDRVLLAFSSPEGPAVLKLGRQGGETTVDLALKIPAAAAKAGMLPAPGQVKLMFGNMGDAEAAITINAKTIKIAAGVGGPKTPNGPTLELPPGKYKYSLQIAGRPVRTSELTVGADDTWGLMVAPGGAAVMPLQVY